MGLYIKEFELPPKTMSWEMAKIVISTEIVILFPR